MLIYLGIGVLVLLLSLYLERKSIGATLESIGVEQGDSGSYIVIFLAVLVVVTLYPILILANVVSMVAGYKN